MDWRDFLDTAEDELRAARRLSRDDPAAELKLRLERLDIALDFIESARGLLIRARVKAKLEVKG